MRMSPSCGCCGGACVNCSGSVPFSLSAVVSGVANDPGPVCTGDNCTILNTTYVMDNDGPCGWTYSGISVCGFGGGTIIAELIDAGGGNYTLGVTLNVNTRLTIYWEKTYVGKPNCAAWSSESIPLSFYTDAGTPPNVFCDGSGITALLLTAL